MSYSRTAVLGLLLILILEAVLFASCFRNFYCGDSIYWLSRVIQDWSDIRDRFSSLDGLGQYRPVTFLFYSFVVHPLTGLSVYRQHAFPFLFHALNTLLVYAIGRRLFPADWQALLVAFFFGVSTTGAYITYDNTFLPDYLYAFFSLLALLVLCRATERRSLPGYVLSAVVFLFALFSKESGITFPAAAFLLLLLLKDGSGSYFPIRKVIASCLPFAVLASGYLVWHLILKGGHLYPAGAGQPHQLVISFATLWAKVPYLLGALGLPLPLDPKATNWLRVPAYWFLMPVLLWMLACTLRGFWLRKPLYVAAIVWVVVTASPALFIVENTWEQNLYVPLLGLAWIFGQSMAEAKQLLERVLSGSRLAWWLPISVVFVLAWATGRNAALVRRTSWMAAGSQVTKNCLEDLQHMYPRIPSNSLIYIERIWEDNIAWHFDSGRLAATFYQDPTIRMRFSDDGLPPPSRAMLDSGKVFVLKYLGGHLYDVTQRIPVSVFPAQPRGVIFTPSRIKKGESVTIEVLGGEGMELDCQYVLNSRGPTRTVYGWVTADSKGRQTLVVNTPGHYVISAIRNSLRGDWIPVHYEWDCLAR
jgi:hypothetical protein